MINTYYICDLDSNQYRVEPLVVQAKSPKKAVKTGLGLKKVFRCMYGEIFVHQFYNDENGEKRIRHWVYTKNFFG